MGKALVRHRQVIWLGIRKHFTYPIEDGSPALHGDALEDGKHGEADVVEGRDASVRPLPLLQARAFLILAEFCPERR